MDSSVKKLNSLGLKHVSTNVSTITAIDEILDGHPDYDPLHVIVTDTLDYAVSNKYKDDLEKLRRDYLIKLQALLKLQVDESLRDMGLKIV